MIKDALMNSNHSSLFISLLSLCFYKHCSKSLFYNNTRPAYLNVYSKLTMVLLKKTIVLRRARFNLVCVKLFCVHTGQLLVKHCYLKLKSIII